MPGPAGSAFRQLLYVGAYGLAQRIQVVTTLETRNDPAGTGLPTYKQLKITLPFGAELPLEESKPAEAASAS